MKLCRFSLLISTILLVSACGLKKENAPAASNATAPLASQVKKNEQPIRISGLPDFTQLVEREGPAVVNISIKQNRKTSGPSLRGIPEDDPLYDFFRRFNPPEETPRDETVQSLGSGFIVTADGVILTNAHVVANADEVTVRLTDKREFKAQVLGTDKRTDVAVLKIPGKDLPTVHVGSSDKLKSGEWVVAIGSPFGFDNSVTAGIVSAKGRSLPDENYVPFIQTDVPINPGNSGGPLFNLSGEVVGINSQIYSRTGGYMGLSFAIPIDVALKVADQLRATGHVSRGRLGVQIQELSPELATSFGLKEAKGALVVSVEANGPAAQAGIQPGDVIIDFNGQKVETSHDLPVLVGNAAPGSTATVNLQRRGKAMELRLVLGEMPSDTDGSTPASPAPILKNKLGLTLENLSDENRRAAGISRGVGISESAGVAAKAGLEAGDILLAINDQPVASADEANRLLNAAKGPVALLVKRRDQTLYIPVNP